MKYELWVWRIIDCELPNFAVVRLKKCPVFCPAALWCYWHDVCCNTDTIPWGNHQFPVLQLHRRRVHFRGGGGGVLEIYQLGVERERKVFDGCECSLKENGWYISRFCLITWLWQQSNILPDDNLWLLIREYGSGSRLLSESLFIIGL